MRGLALLEHYRRTTSSPQDAAAAIRADIATGAAAIVEAAAELLGAGELLPPRMSLAAGVPSPRPQRRHVPSSILTKVRKVTDVR